MFRRESQTARQENEMVSKNLRELENIDIDSVSDPMHRLRLLCLSRGANGIMGLGRMFRRMDDDGNKRLSHRDFVHALKETGLDLTNREANDLCKKFDRNNSGSINVSSFLSHLRPPMSESRQKILAAALKKLDKAGNGVISVDNLKHVFSIESDPRYVSGEESEEMLMKRSMVNFVKDATEDGMITHEELLDYYSAVSASIDDDCYFDLIIRQAYKL